MFTGFTKDTFQYFNDIAANRQTSAALMARDLQHKSGK